MGVPSTTGIVGRLAAAVSVLVVVAGLVVAVAPPAAAATLKLRVFDATVTEGTGGTVQAVFLVRLSAKAPKDITFTWSTREGSATAPSDFSGRSARKATIKKGKTSTVLFVTVKADAIDEYTESFGVRISKASGNVKIKDANGRAKIYDDDRPPKIKVASVSAQVVEGTQTSGVVERKIIVTLSSPSAKKISALYTVKERKAKFGSDLRKDTGELVFKKGVTSRKAVVRVVADDRDETDEGFGLKWSQASHVRLPSSATDAQILDDDDPTRAEITGFNPASPAQIANPRVFGVAPAESTVNVYLSDDCTGPVAATGSAAQFAAPGIILALPAEASYLVSVKGTNTVGGADTNCSASLTYVWDQTAPAVPDGLQVVQGSPTTNTSPTVRGTAEAGSTVSVYVDTSCTGTPVEAVSAAQFVDPAGVSPGALTPNVLYQLRFTATDAAGNVSDCSAQLPLEIDTIDPAAPAALAILPAPITSDTTPRLQGTAESGSTVRVFVGSCPSAQLTTGTAEQFAGAGIAVSALAEGDHDLFARAVDSAGNVGPCAGPETVTVDTTAPAAPTGLTLETSSPTANPVARVSGDAENGSTVTLYRDTAAAGGCNIEVGSGPVSTFRGQGIPTSSLPDGSHTLRATATDGLGREGSCSTTAATVVVDATAPAEPTNLQLVGSSPSSDPDSFAVRGAVSGDAVSVAIYRGAACGTQVGSGTAAAFQSAGGIAVSLPNSSATYTLRAVATDGVGLTSDCSADSVTAEVDVTAPAEPTNLELVGSSPTSDRTPRIRGSAEPGATVTLFADSDDGGTACDVQLASGAESVFSGAGLLTSSLADGVYTVHARASDGLQSSGCSGSLVIFEVDGTAPAAPTVNPIDDGAPGDYFATGNAESGSTVRVYLNGSCAGAPVDSLGAVPFANSGAALGSLGANNYSVSAEAEDAVGNVSVCSTPINFTVT